MKEENSIEVKNVEKTFKIYYDKGNTIKDKVVTKGRGKYEKRHVLKGISFEVKKGEAVGFIGHNGCGKSTTLKLLSKIMYPDFGTIEMRGRVSSLIELGAGFHPDLSGKENIYINASIFGLSKMEIDNRLDDIIAFSELEEFIDNPVRTYSSGMYMRLAFAVAINVDADILLIDEILAVGDINFQKKCFNKLREVKGNGVTIVIVSHSLAQIEQFCEKTIWINDGEIKAEGKPYDVHSEYLKYMDEEHQSRLEDEQKKDIEEKNNQKEQQKSNEQKKDIWGTGDAYFKEISITGKNGKSKKCFFTEESIEFFIKFGAKKIIENAVVGIGIIRNDGIICYGTNTMIDRLKSYSIKDNSTVIIKIEHLNLLPGQYIIDFEIKNKEGVVIQYFRKALEIEIVSDISDIGLFRLKHEWSIDC